MLITWSLAWEKVLNRSGVRSYGFTSKRSVIWLFVVIILTIMPTKKGYTRFPVGKYIAMKRKLQDQVAIEHLGASESVQNNIKRLKRVHEKRDKVLQDLEQARGDILLPVQVTPPKSSTKPFSDALVKNRCFSPTEVNENGKIVGPERSGSRRRSDTKRALMAIHGASKENMKPAYDGVLATLNNGPSTSELTEMIEKSPKIKEKVIPDMIKKNLSIFNKSDVNMVRSTNVLYKGGVASKYKYNSIRSSLLMHNKENNQGKTHIEFMKNCQVPKLLTYQELMQEMGKIDTGVLYDVRENLCLGLNKEFNVDGKYRDLRILLTKMAVFYFTVNETRVNKLQWFGKEEGTFLVAIGGDGAPFGKDDSALAWLVSFVNCGHRIASSEENFLLLGANCSEDCEPIRRYILMLSRQMTEIENECFTVTVKGEQKVVKFKFELLPNDMKCIAFLSGELSISATYFSPFANISKEHIDDPAISSKWKPWAYSTRLNVVAAVEKKKAVLEKSQIKSATKRVKLTKYIAEQHSRQEFVPLIGRFVDKVKVDPLHVKNNAWQQWHVEILNYAISKSELSDCDTVYDVPANCPFSMYYVCLLNEMRASRLAKKVRKWFIDGRKRTKTLEYRFTGKESIIFCHNFMKFIEALEHESDGDFENFQLHVFAFVGLHLRECVSLFSRVSITNAQLVKLKQSAQKYYVAIALFQKGATPTSWTIGNVVPVHTKQLHDNLGAGLGINTMEGREAKHVVLSRFASKTQHKNRWAQNFKHEYICLFWLRENGCDDKKYKSNTNTYIPEKCFIENICYCGLPKQAGLTGCKYCTHFIRQVLEDCASKRTITMIAKRYME